VGRLGCARDDGAVGWWTAADACRARAGGNTTVLGAVAARQGLAGLKAAFGSQLAADAS
jgi:hypothetical protein